MELKRLITAPNGDTEATWVLTQDQMATLYWYAINDLVGRGLAHATDITQEQFEEMKKAQDTAFLAAMDTKDLPRA